MSVFFIVEDSMLDRGAPALSRRAP
uniref:Uncharacterized protein n=1 Tax=Anguilla anguilla TaxID=7936 RepID=A0A0E9TV97_ANGAN